MSDNPRVMTCAHSLDSSPDAPARLWPPRESGAKSVSGEVGHGRQMQR
jgi:hypothetical protein